MAKKKMLKLDELHESKRKELVQMINEAVDWHDGLSMEEQIMVVTREYMRIHKKEIEGVDIYEATLTINIPKKMRDKLMGISESEEEENITSKYIY